MAKTTTLKPAPKPARKAGPNPYRRDDSGRYPARDTGRYQSGYRTFNDGSYREDFGSDR